MPTTTYSFSGIEGPSSTHVAEAGDHANRPSAQSLSTLQAAATELATADYEDIAAQDADDYRVQADPVSEWAFLLTKFVVHSGTTDLDVLATVTPGAAVSPRLYLFIWDNTDSEWDQLDMTAGAGEQDLIGESSDVARYVNGSDEVYIVIEEWQPVFVGSGYFDADYVRLTVTYTEVAPDPETHTLAGRVYNCGHDTPGTEVEAATITIPGQSVETDSDGQFSFDALTPGEYTVTVTKTGLTFVPATKIVDLYGDQLAVDFAATAWTPASAETGVWTQMDTPAGTWVIQV